ncbi:ATP-binding protein [Catenulispora subtropica]|uniref:Tetratricopeptide repeat protein n=1 Tax=Catenulispora subtropica TaxID=450798 RepID=A0ABP5EE96_9ACTN
MDVNAAPDPGEARDLPEFISALVRLRLWAGGPSYRTLAKRVGPLMRPPQVLPHTTIGDVFQDRRRWLDIDLVTGVVRALGLSEADVARWRAACVRVHAEAKSGPAAGVLRQLPAGVATFTGRERELAGLTAAVDAARRTGTTVVISAIEGMGGVGKTQLALHAVGRLADEGRFRDAQLYVNLHSFDPERPPADPAQVLDGLLRALQVPARQIPAGLDERAAMFRDRLHGRDAVLILDDAAGAEQIRDLIPASPSCAVVVTSRRSLAELDGARLFALDVFSREEALELLVKVVGRERIAAEPEAADEILAAVGGLPLAVALIAARLRARPAWGLAEAAGVLRARGLDAIRAGDRSLRSVLDLSFHGLSDGARAALGAIGVHPGADYTAPAIAAVTGGGVAQAEEALEELVLASLARERVSDRFEVHDLVRAYASEVVADGASFDRAGALARLSRWFLLAARSAASAMDTPALPDLADPDPGDLAPPVFDSYDAAMAWFDAERENLVAVHRAAASADLYEVVWQLPIATGQYRKVRFRMAEHLEANQLALDAARSRGDKSVLGWHLLLAAGPLQYLDRREESGACIDEALAIYRDLRDARCEGWALLEKGVLDNLRGRHHEAISALERSLVLNESFGDRRRVMICGVNLGVAHAHLGDPKAALRFFEPALAEARANDERRAVCILLGDIGEMRLALGEIELARSSYSEQAERTAALGNRYDHAVALVGLGDTLKAEGRFDEARELWKQAYEESVEIGSLRVDAIRQRIQALGDPLSS